MAMTAVSSTPVFSVPGLQENMNQQKHHKELQMQTIEGNQDAMDCMVEQGLQWEIKLTPARETPLHSALKEKKLKLFEKLLRIANLVHVPNVYGETPMHLACRLGLEEAVSKLLEAGADMNAQDSEECTPVYHAVCEGCISCVKLLIKAGCDLDMLNNEDMAPMDRALLYKDHDMVALLLQAGCSTHNLKGHVFFRDHLSSSFFFGLWSDSTVENMQLFLDCGYTVTKSEITSLRDICRQLELKAVLNMLVDFTEQPKSLMWHCRRSIRQLLIEMRAVHHTSMDSMISRLPVPSQLQEFLSMKESQSQETE